MMETIHEHRVSRRRFLGRAAALGACGFLGGLSSLDAYAEQAAADNASKAVIGPREPLKITKLETFIHRNSWTFVKITTDAGIVGWGEMLKDKSKACAAEAQEMASYLVDKDPRPITQHWQAIYRHGFYRGGPILTAVLSGIDMALWDIKGKALGLPVHELLGGPTRQKIRVYGSRQDVEEGRCSAMKTLLAADGRAPYKYVEGAGYVQRATKFFAEIREALGPDVDIGVEFHGAVQPSTSLLLMKALEPYQPYFFEEPVQCQNVDELAELASKTHIPVAAGERVYTKWGFREILEKNAAGILQPDICYAGGITELRLIAGMAETYYVPLAPHNPQGPCSLAASCQIAAAIPNFLIQEQGTRSHANMLKTPFQVEKGYLPVPTAPGLGIEIDEEKFMALVGEPMPYRRTYDRDDGSVVDW
ncbi:MAG TPA: galactonate dehydratase [Pirellulales bacterium]|nr:galactonate dehydratase [Pirellulales bacterium]